MADYEPISDIEEGITDDKVTNKYPNANEKEAKLLNLLDEVIENAVPEFKPPLLPVGSTAGSEIKDLIASLKIPTLALFGVVSGALLVIVMDSPIAKFLYPYIQATLLFISSIPTLKKSFAGAALLILESVDSRITSTFDQIDGMADKALNYVNNVDDAINDALEPIKPKLEKATKMEKMLQKINPNIDIPDPQDIEDELGDAAEIITDVIEKVKSGLDLRQYIPKAAQSLELFNLYLVYPTLAIFLFLQLYNVYLSQDYGVDGDSSDDVINNTTQFLRSGAKFISETNDIIDFRNLLEDTNSSIISNTTNSTSEPETFKEEVAEQWQLIVHAFSAFFAAVIQILVTFIGTQANVIKLLINKKILSVSTIINASLDETVTPVFEKVLVQSMEKIKTKFLKLLDKVEMIEGPLSTLEGSMDKLPKGLPKFGL